MIQIEGEGLFALRYETKHAKIYSAYDSINRSLDHCLSNATYINKHRTKTGSDFVQENINAHHASIFVNYGRCFASGRVKLERKIVPKEYLETHDKLIKLRNEYISHSGGNGEISLNIMALYPNRNNCQIVSILAPQLVNINFINKEFLSVIQQIVMHLKSYVKDKMSVHYKKIQEDIMEIDIESIYREFDKFDLCGVEYSPQISPGNYQYKLEIQPNGLFRLIGTKR